MNLKAVLCLILVGIGATPAEAGGRHNIVCAPRAVVSSYVAPTLAVVPPVYATVSPAYQAEATATASFRHSAEYQEYRELIGYRKAMEQVFQVQGYPLPAENAAELAGPVEQPLAPAPESPTYNAPQNTGPGAVQAASDTPPCVPGGGAAPFSAPLGAGMMPPEGTDLAAGNVNEFFKGAYPILAANCLKCHTSSESKGGFSLAEAIVQAKQAGDCDTLREIALSVSSGQMPPPPSKLTAEDRLNMVNAILTQPAGTP